MVELEGARGTLHLAEYDREDVRPRHRQLGTAAGDAGEGDRTLFPHVEELVVQALDEPLHRAARGADLQHPGHAAAHRRILARVEERVHELPGHLGGHAPEGAQRLQEQVVLREQGQQVGDEGGGRPGRLSQEQAHQALVTGAQVGDGLQQGIGAGRLVAGADRLDLAEQRVAVEGEARLGEGVAGGVVHHLRGAETHPSRAQALLERAHVAPVEAAREGQCGHAQDGGEGEEHPRRLRGDEGHREEGDRASDQRSELVEAHVDDGLGRTLLRFGQRREQQLVAGAEERAGVDVLPGAREDRGPHPRVEQPEQRDDEDGRRAHRHRAREPEGTQR